MDDEDAEGASAARSQMPPGKEGNENLMECRRNKSVSFPYEGRKEHNNCNCCGYLKIAHGKEDCTRVSPCKIRQELDEGTLLSAKCEITSIDVKRRVIFFRAFLSFDVSCPNRAIDPFNVILDAFVVCKRRKSFPKRTKVDGTPVNAYACKLAGQGCGCTKMKEIHDVLYAFILRTKQELARGEDEENDAMPI